MSGVGAFTLTIGVALSLAACNDEPRRPLGASCTSDQQCESGHCVNGVCVAPFLEDADVTEVADATSAEVVTSADLTVVPRALDNDRIARFEFVSDPPGASFECSYDGGPFEPCVSPFEIATSEGEHTLVIRVYWPDGSAEETTLTYTWRVDLTAPLTTLVTVPPPLDNASEVSFGFEVSEVATSSCRIDAGAWAACTSPHVVSGLGDGPHHFEVASTDEAGNVEDPPASYRWTIDTSPPDTRIESGPGALVAETSATFRFSSPDAVVAFECTLDTEAFAACTSPWQVRDLADGEHTFAVRAIDALGASDPTPAEWTWVVDTVEPIAGVCGAAAGGSTQQRPSVGLCSAGSPSAVSGEGPFSWTCQGSGGGASASCTANRSCAEGALEWTVDASTCSAPVATTSHGERLAATDASQPTTGSQTFDCLQGVWAAVGAGTCATAVRGTCGAAHGGDSIAAPTSGLCASGTPTSVSGDGPFVWSCLGADGGDDALCESDRSCADQSLTWEVDGVTCSAQVATAVNGASRNATDVSEPAVGSRVFTCDQGTWEAADAGSCDAVIRGICGDAHGGDSLAPPTSGLCALGTPTAVTGEGPFSWRCLGDHGGADADCASDRSCAAQSVSWNVDGESCGAATAAGLHEESRTVTDGSEPAVGSQTFTCDQGNWVPSASGTCAAVVHGVCGGAHGGNSLAPPTQDLCASGTATSVAGDGPYTWSCLGESGGDDVGCSSNRSCAGESLSWSVGGLSCGASVTGAPSGESRSANDGTEPNVGSQAFECAQGEWEALGAGTCDTVIHGSCGPAHGGDSLAAPTQGLCASGSPTAVSGDGPFTWSCLGAIGGDSDNCSSNQSCAGTGQTWTVDVSTCGGDVAEAAHGESSTADDVQEPTVGSRSFDCDQGDWEPVHAGTCVTVIHGACGAAHGGDSLAAPSAGLCASGTPTAVSGDGPFTWSCLGQSGGDDEDCTSDRSCAGASVTWDSPNSACGGSVTAANDGQSRSASDTGEPVVGSETFTCDQGEWVASGDGTCVTNGVCGSAAGGDSVDPPSTNLCASGTPSSVSSDVGKPFTWTCSGSDGGANDSCSSNRSCTNANRTWTVGNSTCNDTISGIAHGGSSTATDSTQPTTGNRTYNCSQGSWSGSGNGTCVTNGVCGSANGGSTPGAPTTNLCSSGNASSVTGNGPFDWTCTGFDGGSTATCSSNRSCGQDRATWGVDNANCNASLSSGAHAALRQVRDDDVSTLGSRPFKCEQGLWTFTGDGTCFEIWFEIPQDGARYPGLKWLDAQFGTFGSQNGRNCRLYRDGSSPPGWKECEQGFSAALDPQGVSWIFEVQLKDDYGELWIVRNKFSN